jgi:CheY-like chemotaxis protein
MPSDGQSEVRRLLRRLLIVEEEQSLRDLLTRRLAEAGYEVDSLSSGNGLSLDIVGLINPDLMLIDPFLGDMPIAAVARVLAKLHTELGFKLLLVDSGRDPKRLGQVAAACDADGLITKKELLQGPADAVAERFLPGAGIEAPQALELDDGEGIEIPIAPTPAEPELEIEIELSPEPPEPRPPRKPPPNPPPPAPRVDKPPPQPSGTPKGKPAGTGAMAKAPTTAAPAPKPRGTSGQRLLEMIEEEIVDLDKVPPKPPDALRITVSLLSKHNFYVGATGDLRSGGVFVATEPSHAVGRPVQIHLEVPFVAPLETSATVEWVQAGEARYHGRASVGCFGLSLAHLPQKDREALEVFFRERAPFKHLAAAVKRTA